MIYTINNCIRAFGYTKFDNLIADMGSVDNLKAYVIANGYTDIAVAEDTELLLVDADGKTYHTGCYGAKIKTYPDPYTMDYTDYQFVMYYLDDASTMRYMPFYSDGYEYTAPSIKDCMWACARPRVDNKYYEGFDLVKFGELQDNEEYVLIKIWYNNASDDFKTARKDVGYVTPYNDGISCMYLNTGAAPIKFKKYSNKFKFELDGTEYYLYRQINGTELKLSAISTSSTDTLITRCILTKYTGTSTSDLPDSTSFEGTKVSITERNPLCFTSTGDSTIALEKTGKGHNNSIYYKIGDDGIWKLWDCTPTSLSNNKKMYLERFDESNGISRDKYTDYCTFKMTGSIAASGDITSLIYYNSNLYSLFSCFANLFKDCSSLTQAPELPSTTLSSNCYANMFQNCTSLTQAPELPATTLTLYCYEHMFDGCSSLVQAPALPATKLADFCYNAMFQGCTSLTTTPELPVTKLANFCYAGMFQDCTSLTTAPALPATTLMQDCYNSMFWGCTSLTTAPELPATETVINCYNYMFYSCSNLNYVKALFTNIADFALDNWLLNVSSTGTFIKSKDATWTNEQAGIPTGWTVQVEGGVTPEPEPERDYLCFTSTGDSTVAMTQEGTPNTSANKVIQYKLNNGQWQTWDLSEVSLHDGDKMYLKSDDTIPISESYNKYKKFVMTGSIATTGNIMSLLNFGDTLTEYAFNKLFSNCASLTQAPSLPVTTLTGECYYYMFQGCTSLTIAPALPATALFDYCYFSMFEGCTSLTTAPELPATTLIDGCYKWMFEGCTNLNYVKAMFTTDPTSGEYTTEWLSGVSSTGTFVKNAAATWTNTDAGIPTGWTVQTASPDK